MKYVSYEISMMRVRRGEASAIGMNVCMCGGRGRAERRGGREGTYDEVGMIGASSKRMAYGVGESIYLPFGMPQYYVFRRTYPTPEKPLFQKTQPTLHFHSALLSSSPFVDDRRLVVRGVREEREMRVRVRRVSEAHRCGECRRRRRRCRCCR